MTKENLYEDLRKELKKYERREEIGKEISEEFSQILELLNLKISVLKNHLTVNEYYFRKLLSSIRYRMLELHNKLQSELKEEY